MRFYSASGSARNRAHRTDRVLRRPETSGAFQRPLVGRMTAIFSVLNAVIIRPL